MRVLVFGVTGQVGTELLRTPRAPHLHVLSASSIDLTNQLALREVLDREEPDLVINAAAYTAVDQAEKEEPRAFAVNAEGPRSLAKWCDARGRALIHLSTDYVFGGEKSSPYLESDPTGPINAYGRSKLAGEQAVREELERHVILRTSWVFSSHRQNFVKTMLRLGREREELRVVADQVGRPTAAQDIALTIWWIAARLAEEQRLPWGTFHFAGDGATSWHGFAAAIFEAARLERAPRLIAITSEHYPTPAKRPRNSVLDTARLEQAFQLKPRSWRDGLAEVLRDLSTVG